MSVEGKVIDLLTWIKDYGFTPRRIPGRDLCLCTITRRVRKYGDLQPHQKNYALWIPNVRGLREAGLRLELEQVDCIVLARNSYFLGAGGTEREACLSVLNHVRANQLAA